MQIHLLDMGQKKYGDCILITRNGRSILIDGGHPEDTAAIRFQLSKLLGQAPPFKISLLIVTHCHNDHIGCLPELIKLGDLQPERALVADERLGFGIPLDDAANFHALSDGKKSLAIALQEEDHSDLPAEELEQFMYDAGRLVDKYQSMLENLGDNVIRYGREDQTVLRALETEFSDFGLKIIGPSIDHLLICSEVIARTADSGIAADAEVDQLSLNELAALYKSLVKKAEIDAEFGEDRPGIGAAKNNQSLVLSVSADELTALLAGDMQFAKAEVPSLNTHMLKLLESINTHADYDFIKLTHHASYNGLDEKIFQQWLKKTKHYAHTGGRMDPSHPDPDVLDLLKSHNRDIYFARTDRNGQITVEKKNGKVVFFTSKSQKLNNFSINKPTDEAESTQPQMQNIQQVSTTANKPEERVPISTKVPSIQEQAVSTNSSSQDSVEVTTRLPHTSTKVTITIEVQPQKKNDSVQITNDLLSIDTPPLDRLRKLLFVTCSSLLAKNLSQPEVDDIIQLLKNLPTCSLVDLPASPDAEAAAPYVRDVLKSENFKGVVIVGGYDVVPSQQLNVIDNGLRATLASTGLADADNFIVWSDDVYGDSDDDTMPEYPVSRIPDAHTPGLILKALTTSPFAANTKFGVRNSARQFADLVYPVLPGTNTPIEISELYGSNAIPPPPASSAVYYMLHGSDTDSTRFWGEKRGGSLFEAIHIDNLPHLQPGSVIFTGCCWGALTVLPTAYRKKPHIPLRHKTVDTSIALKYLDHGALAFIGCTGSHYSPVKSPFDAYGKPMHDYFWQEISNNKSPAESLFYAKMRYASEIPHSVRDPFGQAAEVKILHEYTCLGLGW